MARSPATARPLPGSTDWLNAGGGLAGAGPSQGTAQAPAPQGAQEPGHPRAQCAHSRDSVERVERDTEAHAARRVDKQCPGRPPSGTGVDEGCQGGSGGDGEKLLVPWGYYWGTKMS